MNQLSTKEKIIAQSLLLFNEFGVENITTRHIAKEMGISQGNLHYHYPNKDEILKVIFSNFQKEITGAQKFNGEAFDYQNMFLSMNENFKIMSTYRLFFQQNEVIWRRVPSIKKEITSLLSSKKTEILQLINLYKVEGRFRTEISTAQINFLAEQFIFTISSWLTAGNYITKNYSYEYYAKFLFRIWLPYLNKDEMSSWEKYLNE